MSHPNVVPFPSQRSVRGIPFRFHVDAPPHPSDGLAFLEHQIETQLYYVLDELPEDRAIAGFVMLNPAITPEDLTTLLDLSEVAFYATINGSRDYSDAAVDEYVEHLRALACRIRAAQPQRNAATS